VSGSFICDGLHDWRRERLHVGFSSIAPSYILGAHMFLIIRHRLFTLWRFVFDVLVVVRI
jgi:hypothetical protein